MEAMAPLILLATILWLALPVYYVVQLIHGSKSASKIPGWAAGTCLVAWLLQLPLGAIYGLGCAGGGCSGAGSIAAQVAIVLMLNVAPFVWVKTAFRP
jgi:hypothetical protein